MLILADRVKESSLSTGVGAVTLNGPVAGYQAFSDVLSSGDQTYYTIVNNQAWEVGVGTYSPSSISRDTILSSSTGSKINLSGQSFIFIAYPAEKSVYRNSDDQIVVADSGIRFNDGTVQTTAGGGGGSYTAGNGLQLSGSQFSVDNTVVQSGDNISVLVNNAGYLTSHPSIAAASSSNNSDRTYIQDILLDSNGHVTGITTATETVVDTDTTYSAGTGLQLSGTTFNVDSSVIRSGNNISLLNNNSNYTTSGSNVGQFINDMGYLTSHPTISAASSSNNSGRTYIQDILLDSNGHITGIVTATETVTDTNTTYSAGTGLQLSGTTFSVDSTVARSGNNITIFANDAGYLTQHPTIVAASSVDNAAHYFVQDLMLDSNGHITGVVSTSETIHAAGDGLTFDGVEFAVDGTVARVGMELSQFNNNSTKFISSGNNVSLLTNDAGYLTSHPSVSAASSSNNSGRTYIQDLLVDGNGHVTGIITATETVVDTDTTYSAGSGLVLSGTQFNTAGTGNFSSIVLQAGTPVSTTNQLYNIGGVLYFNGSGLGGSGGGGGASDLDGLSDVAISSVSSGHGIFYNGTNFVNRLLTENDMPSGIDASKIGSGLVSNTEFGYLDGVSSGIQSQINGKAPSETIAGFVKPIYGVDSTNIFLGPLGASSTGAAFSANTIYAVRVFVSETRTFTKMRCNVAASGSPASTLRLGIVNETSSGTPGTLIVDTGTAAANSTGLKDFVISQTLSPGHYWLLFSSNSSGGQLTCATGGATSNGTFCSSTSNHGTIQSLNRALTYAPYGDQTGATWTVVHNSPPWRLMIQ